MVKLRVDYGDEAIPVRSILNAFIKPMVERMRSSSLRNDLFAKIMGCCMSDRAQKLPSKVEPQMREVLKVFIEELTRSLPHLSHELVLWRLHFSFGAVAHTLLFSERLQDYSEMEIDTMDTEATLKRVVDYCIGGLMAESELPQK